jgi:hypothetical protein
VQNKTREEAYTYFGHKVALFSELKGKAQFNARLNVKREAEDNLINSKQPRGEEEKRKH